MADISQDDIAYLEQNGILPMKLGEVLFDLLLEDVEVLSEDIPAGR